MDEFRHKVVKIHESEFALGGLIRGQPFTWIRKEILNAGKSNHKVHGSFTINQNTTSSKSVSLFVLTDTQFAAWIFLRARSPGSALASLTGNSVFDPEYYVYSSKDKSFENNFEFSIEQENVLYFLFESNAILGGKKIKIEIWEEWRESILPIDVVTTTPPEDRSIEETIRSMITSARKELKILSPYVDMHLVKELREQYDKGIKIFMLTRDIKEKSHSRENKQALTYLQEKLKENHRINQYVHSRMIICDELNALVSSADLTEGSLKSHYNAGIVLSDPILVQKLLNYFNQAFIDSKPMTT